MIRATVYDDTHEPVVATELLRKRLALEEMVHNAPVHQHEEEIAKVVYPIEKVRELGKFIEQAERLADSPLVRRRVQVFRYSYDNLLLYLRMRQAEDQAKFALAARLAEQQLKLHEVADKFDTVIYKMGSLNWNDENHSHLTGGWVKQNKERLALTDGTKGQLVAMLPEVWSFSTDPDDQGIAQKWFTPDTDTGNWRTIRVTRVWEPQGLMDEMGHGYDGAGWYRTELMVPARFAGRKVMLNFGGAYGSMKIWVNGKRSGERPYDKAWWYYAYNTNFDIDLSEAIKPGQENVLVIRVDNDFELGGISRRVFLWSPKNQASKE